MMDSRRYGAALRRWLWIPTVGVLAACALSYGIAAQVPPVYEGNVMLLVNFATRQAPVTYSDALLGQQLVKTYAHMVVQPVVLQEVGPRLRLALPPAELARAVTAQPIRDTQLLTVSAQALRPELARDIANMVATVFIEQEAQRQTGNPISIVQPALLPAAPMDPGIWFAVTLAGLVALLTSAATVYALALVDDTIKHAADAERAAGAAVLGIIPIARLRGRGTYSIEPYRMLHTALDFACGRQPARTLLITSPGAQEGKTTVAVHLASAMAQAGRRVVLLDADLRSPGVRRELALPEGPGLCDILQAKARPVNGVLSYAHVGPSPNLWVMTAGAPCSSAPELLRSERFNELLQALREQAETVILDAPPTLGLADTLVLANQADAALLVVAARTTRSTAAEHAASALRRSGARLLGVVLNRAPAEDEASAALATSPEGSSRSVLASREAG